MKNQEKAVGSKLLEDKHYSFVEYAGSNITHWSFLDEEEKPINVDRLCAKSMLIADGDDAKGKKAVRHSQLGELLGDRFIKLECRELENLVTPEILNQIIAEYTNEKTLSLFETRNYETYKKKTSRKIHRQ